MFKLKHLTIWKERVSGILGGECCPILVWCMILAAVLGLHCWIFSLIIDHWWKVWTAGHPLSTQTCLLGSNEMIKCLFQHVICCLCSVVNKIWIYEMCDSLHSAFLELSHISPWTKRTYGVISLIISFSVECFLRPKEGSCNIFKCYRCIWL